MKLSKKDYRQLKTLAKTGCRLVKKCVIANVYSKSYKKVGGLSIYFPDYKKGIEPSYYDLYWSVNTNWLSFINKYLKK